MIAIASRREMLASFAGVLSVPVIATVPMREPTPDPLDAIRRTADLLADMMAEARGGEWEVIILPKGGAR